MNKSKSEYTCENEGCGWEGSALKGSRCPECGAFAVGIILIYESGLYERTNLPFTEKGEVSAIHYALHNGRIPRTTGYAQITSGSYGRDAGEDRVSAIIQSKFKHLRNMIQAGYRMSDYDEAREKNTPYVRPDVRGY
jgi:hypothetical protein